MSGDIPTTLPADAVAKQLLKHIGLLHLQVAVLQVKLAEAEKLAAVSLEALERQQEESGSKQE